MRHFSFIFALFSLLCVGGAGAIEVRQTVDPEVRSNLHETMFSPLFAALQSGDVLAFKTFMHGSMYERYRVLIEQNAEYGQHLRDYYEGATFELLEVSEASRAYLGTVSISWPDGNRAQFDLLVNEDKAGRQQFSVPPSQYE